MKMLIVIIFAFLSMVTVGKEVDSLILEKKIVQSQPADVKISIPQTIQIKDITEKSETTLGLDKNMPWIAAILIGIITAFVNFWVAHRLRQSNERNLQRQIENAKETTLIQFNATLATKNRQDWINELRQNISEFLTYAMCLTPSFVSNNQDERRKYLEKLAFTKSKIELLTNEDKPEQKELLDTLGDILDILSKGKEDFKKEDMQAARSKTISAARKLFKIHWGKIKILK